MELVPALAVILQPLLSIVRIALFIWLLVIILDHFLNIFLSVAFIWSYMYICNYISITNNKYDYKLKTFAVDNVLSSTRDDHIWCTTNCAFG